MAKILGRFLLLLLGVLAVVSYALLPSAGRLADKWFMRELESRSQLIFSSVQYNLEDALASNNVERVQQLFRRIAQDEPLLAIGFCDLKGDMHYHGGNFPRDFSCRESQTPEDKPTFSTWQREGGPLLIAKFPLRVQENSVGALVVLNDLGSIEYRNRSAYIALFVFLLSVCLLAVLIALLVAYLTLRSWLNAVRVLLQENEGDKRKEIPAELKPLILDLYRLLRRRSHKRHTTNPARELWTSDSLRQFLKAELPDEEIIVVSNREPYVHSAKDGQTVLQKPAGGLVSALEPILRACKGTWIAHGSGSADKTMVDANNRLLVPPDDPAYTLRRVWLSEEESSGYYDGFANEGLWPLCHLVFTRPLFREGDWAQYQAVNRKFADAVVAEAKTKTPIVLVQDYHFALLPALIRERLPRAIIATFWHIPWPNAESFSICPWREEILKGMLGSDILGFHTQFHCNNFFDTADRFLECRIDRERATATTGGRTTLVRPYPISIEWLPAVCASLPPVPVCRENVLKALQLPPKIKLGVGVERFDYTKGIVDRFQAIARFLRQNPTWMGKFSFVQVAAPTRSKLQRYKEEQEETIKLAEAINTELGRGAWKPIILVTEQYNQERVFELFRAADFCIVSSLHDGMNLVAKEFVAAREDDRGVLILSSFAGASEELEEALIVNPHDTKGMAESIRRALNMSVAEQEQRMHLLRGVVRNHNIYWWAGKLLRDVARIRNSTVISDASKPSDLRTRLSSLFNRLQTTGGKKAA